MLCSSFMTGMTTDMASVCSESSVVKFSGSMAMFGCIVVCCILCDLQVVDGDLV